MGLDLWKEGMNAVEDAVHIYVPGLIPDLEPRAAKSCEHPKASVVHQDVDLAKSLDRFLCGTSHSGAIRYVYLDSMDALGGVRKFLHGLIGVGLSPIGNHNLHSGGDESVSYPKADAVRGASDEGYLTIQINAFIHLSHACCGLFRPENDCFR